MTLVKDFNEGIKNKFTAFYFKNTGNISDNDCMEYSVKLADLSSYNDKKESFFGKQIPNPKIAAVFRTDDYIYCAARSGIKYGDHAEYTILNSILGDYIVKDTDILYTTLEPCTPDSRSKWTESCSEMIINKKIKHVYIGTLDQNPLVFGCGVNSLLENGIEVRFYEKKFRDKLRKMNEEFFLFCQRYPDIKILKRVDRFLNEHIDEEALRIYYKTDNVTDELYIKFYREMISNNQIKEGELDGTIQVSKELALAFAKKPSTFVPGYNFGIINHNEYSSFNIQNNYKNKRELFDYSLLRLCGTKTEKNIFFEIIKRVSMYNLHFDNIDDLYYFYNNFFVDLHNFREYFINAIVHNNYEYNIGVTIEIGDKDENDKTKFVMNKDKCIKLINILSKDIDITLENNKLDLDKKFKDRNLLSIPANPILMQFFVRSGLAENTGFGFNDDGKIKVEFNTLNQNGINILETRIKR